MASLNQLTITQTHQGLKNKEFSATEITSAVLEHIQKRDKDLSRGKAGIQAYLTITEDLALEQAKKTDEKIKNKEEIGILEGVPMAVKDNILVEDIKCTAGSKILENYIAPYNSTVIQKLKKAGAVIIGKTNCDEFAMGSSTENSSFQITRNPHDLERVPGGSSGGSAAAVANHQCIYALGSDTGGSIRQPASFCGVVGLKPTYGRVSRYGLMAMASSLDQIGPLTKTAKDAKIVLDVIKGKDKLDSTSNVILREQDDQRILSSAIRRTNRDSSASPQNDNIKNLKIGLPKEYFIKGLDSEVEKNIKKAISKFEEMGAKIIEVSLPHTEYALAAYYIIMPAEVSANLARYDGIKYGLSKEGDNLLDVYLESRQHGFGDEPRRRIMLGTYILSAGYYEAYYLKAQKVRTKIKQDFENAFKKVDVLMTPTSPTPAFKIGEKTDDPLGMYLSDIYTVPMNLAGLPAVSIPCGLINNLPVGLQIIGKHFDEERILDIAQYYENIF